MLTTGLTYKASSAQVSRYASSVTGSTIGYNYTYDKNGNILSVSDGTNTTTYVYDSQNQLIRENNQAGGYTHAWTYDAGGNILTTTGSLASTLGTINPLRYRGYVYDQEWDLYYLQSRYYDPEVGRFISPDAFTSTGQGFLGNNMFAYCGNNPVNFEDTAGTICKPCTAIFNDGSTGFFQEEPEVIEEKNADEISVLKGQSNMYEDAYVLRTCLLEDAGFSFGLILLGSDILPTSSGIRTVQHEYGHTKQLKDMGILEYAIFVVVPSVTCYTLASQGKLDSHYYSLPWEYEADLYGKVKGRNYTPQANQMYYLYKLLVSYLSGDGIDMEYASRLNP